MQTWVTMGMIGASAFAAGLVLGGMTPTVGDGDSPQPAVECEPQANNGAEDLRKLLEGLSGGPKGTPPTSPQPVDLAMAEDQGLSDGGEPVDPMEVKQDRVGQERSNPFSDLFGADIEPEVIDEAADLAAVRSEIAVEALLDEIGASPEQEEEVRLAVDRWNEELVEVVYGFSDSVADVGRPENIRSSDFLRTGADLLGVTADLAETIEEAGGTDLDPDFMDPTNFVGEDVVRAVGDFVLENGP